MKSRSFPVSLSLLVLFIAVANVFAQIYYWYWRMPWLDIPMHFLGGMWLAGAVLWYRYFRHSDSPLSLLSTLKSAVGAAIVVGLAWEIFEAYVSYMSGAAPNDMPDTIGDLFSDIAGGAAMALLAWRSVTKK